MKIALSKITITVVTALLVAAMGVSNASVDPPKVGETLAPGESFHVVKTVEVPDFPPKLDVCLVVDLSGSYFDDIVNIKALAPGIFDDVKALVNDVQFCLTSFVDFPISPWGSAASGDYAYRMDQDLTTTKATWINAVIAMATRFGGDGPESQYPAVYQMATGAGNDVPPAGPSLGDIAPGQDPNWRDDATKVLIITTDAPFHNDTDSGGTYPGPSAVVATAALVSAGIKVIALKAPGASTQMDALAAATGGSVQTTSSSSSDIADAILAALEDLTFDVTGTPEACDPLDISLDPDVYFDVPGGETVVFNEWIEVPADVTDVEEICCDVVFTAGDTPIGIQEVCITVKRTVAIDIKPGSFPNSINLKKQKGVIPVAILGSDEFDVTEVDVTTLTFGPGAQVPAHDLTDVFVYTDHLQDVNGDGFVDLVSHYVSGGTGITSGDTEACISGKTNDGINFMGCDSVRTLH